MCYRLSFLVNDLWFDSWADVDNEEIAYVQIPKVCFQAVWTLQNTCRLDIWQDFHVCMDRLLYLEYPYYWPPNVSYSTLRKTLIQRRPDGGYFGRPGSLLSALSFFANLADLPLSVKLELIGLGHKDIFKQVCIAAMALKQELPRGIQLFKAGKSNTTWYFSIFGRVRRETMRAGVEFARMDEGMAAVLYEKGVFAALYFPSL